MVEYEKLYEDVKNAVSEKRFKHSEGVVERALEYAEIYGEDKEKVKLVAIAHDIAKEIPKEETIKYADSIGADLDDVEKKNYKLPHAKIGAKICETKYGFTEDMVNAVKYHTTGRENMSLLEKIIYLADATEPGRTYFNLQYYVDLVKKDIDRAMFEVAKWTIQDLSEKEGIIHLDTVRCYNFYRK
jgi:predicted HD superfamily hydrolase involved in NAD metabolism